MQGHVDGRDFDLSDLGKLERYGPQLRRLVALGMVEEAPEGGAQPGNLVRWQGRRWRLTSESLVCWVVEKAVAVTSVSQDFTQWLGENETDGVLTEGERKRLRELTSRLAPSAMAGLGECLGEFLGALLKRWFSVGA